MSALLRLFRSVARTSRAVKHYSAADVHDGIRLIIATTDRWPISQNYVSAWEIRCRRNFYRIMSPSYEIFAHLMKYSFYCEKALLCARQSSQGMKSPTSNFISGTFTAAVWRRPLSVTTRILRPRLHDTTACQTDCSTSLTTGWMFVYTPCDFYLLSLWSPYVIGHTIIFLPCDFFLFSFLA